jgi:hypothetical protein
VERIRTQRFAEDVGRGLELIPPRVLERIGPAHFHEGSLTFSGDYAWPMPENHYASAFCPYHFAYSRRPADQRCQTVCFTGVPWQPEFEVDAVIHEIGHCLQYALGSFDRGWCWPFYNLIGLPALSGAITTYKADTYCEQFSEAMAAWLLPAELFHHRMIGSAERLLDRGPELLGFFNQLAGLPADTLPVSLRA